MNFFSTFWASEMRVVIRDILASCGSGKQSQKNPEMPSLWNNLFDSHAGDMRIGKMNAHVGIPFVGTDYKFSSFCHTKIHSGNRYFGS